jgi:hypothetical protein
MPTEESDEPAPDDPAPAQLASGGEEYIVQGSPGGRPRLRDLQRQWRHRVY